MESPKECDAEETDRGGSTKSGRDGGKMVNFDRG